MYNDSLEKLIKNLMPTGAGAAAPNPQTKEPSVQERLNALKPRNDGPFGERILEAVGLIRTPLPTDLAGNWSKNVALAQLLVVSPIRWAIGKVANQNT